MQTTGALVRRLWALCNVLRDDGISYQDYLTELTFLLFLKLAEETGTEKGIPKLCRWGELRQASSQQEPMSYQSVLDRLANSPDPKIAEIFAGATTRIRSRSAYERLIRGIDNLAWNGATENGMGDVYEGLIEKNAQESRYGAGQYFTPRALVDAIIRVTNPRSHESVYDPAAGTAGFLVAAGQYSSAEHGKPSKLIGNELVPDVGRMARMNLRLHGLSGALHISDSLSIDARPLKYSVCLTNPPFGIKSGMSPHQTELLDFPTSNKQLAFLQHIYMSLGPRGRGAVVVPENVLFETGVGASVRTHLLDKYNLHTVLRLPPGIFYATGVKTAVLFFARTGRTRRTWIYDLMAANEGVSKLRRLERSHLDDFMAAYGADPFGEDPRESTPCFQSFTREEIRESNDRLDLAPERDHPSTARSPIVLLESITAELEGAMAAAREMRQLVRDADPQ